MRSIEFEYAYRQYKDQLRTVAPGAWAIRPVKCPICRSVALTYREGRVTDDHTPEDATLTVSLYCPKCGHRGHELRRAKG